MEVEHIILKQSLSMNIIFFMKHTKELLPVGKVGLVNALCYFYCDIFFFLTPILWRHNGRHGVSNHQPHQCLLKRLVRSRSKKTPKLRVTGLCAGNSPMTGEFPAQRASNAENVSIWRRRHGIVSQSQHSLCQLQVWLRNWVALSKHKHAMFWFHKTVL